MNYFSTSNVLDDNSDIIDQPNDNNNNNNNAQEDDSLSTSDAVRLLIEDPLFWIALLSITICCCACMFGLLCYRMRMETHRHSRNLKDLEKFYINKLSKNDSNADQSNTSNTGTNTRPNLQQYSQSGSYMHNLSPQMAGLSGISHISFNGSNNNITRHHTSGSNGSGGNLRQSTLTYDESITNISGVQNGSPRFQQLQTPIPMQPMQPTTSTSGLLMNSQRTSASNSGNGDITNLDYFRSNGGNMLASRPQYVRVDSNEKDINNSMNRSPSNRNSSSSVILYENMVNINGNNNSNNIPIMAPTLGGSNENSPITTDHATHSWAQSGNVNNANVNISPQGINSQRNSGIGGINVMGGINNIINGMNGMSPVNVMNQIHGGNNGIDNNNSNHIPQLLPGMHNNSNKSFETGVSSYGPPIPDSIEFGKVVVNQNTDKNNNNNNNNNIGNIDNNNNVNNINSGINTVITNDPSKNVNQPQNNSNKSVNDRIGVLNAGQSSVNNRSNQGSGGTVVKTPETTSEGKNRNQIPHGGQQRNGLAINMNEIDHKVKNSRTPTPVPNKSIVNKKTINKQIPNKELPNIQLNKENLDKFDKLDKNNKMLKQKNSSLSIVKNMGSTARFNDLATIDSGDLNVDVDIDIDIDIDVDLSKIQSETETTMPTVANDDEESVDQININISKNDNNNNNKNNITNNSIINRPRIIDSSMSKDSGLTDVTFAPLRSNKSEINTIDPMELMSISQPRLNDINSISDISNNIRNDGKNNKNGKNKNKNNHKNKNGGNNGGKHKVISEQSFNNNDNNIGLNTLLEDRSDSGGGGMYLPSDNINAVTPGGNESDTFEEMNAITVDKLGLNDIKSINTINSENKSIKSNETMINKDNISNHESVIAIVNKKGKLNKGDLKWQKMLEMSKKNIGNEQINNIIKDEQSDTNEINNKIDNIIKDESEIGSLEARGEMLRNMKDPYKVRLDFGGNWGSTEITIDPSIASEKLSLLSQVTVLQKEKIDENKNDVGDNEKTNVNGKGNVSNKSGTSKHKSHPTVSTELITSSIGDDQRDDQRDDEVENNSNNNSSSKDRQMKGYV